MNTQTSPVQRQRHLTRSQSSAFPQGSSANEKCIQPHSLNKRETLPRSSYRTIQLPSDVPLVPMAAEHISEEVNVPATAPRPAFYHANPSRFFAYSPEGSIQQRYQIYPMSSPGTSKAGPAIVQYAEPVDQALPYYVPASKMVVQDATGEMSAYQIRSPTSSLPQGVVMSGSPEPLHSPQQLAEEASRKRELRLMKNREAARECRRKKKEYVKCLENRVAVLENQNKTLIEELRTLKELEAAKECRRRKKEYVRCLESRLAALELQNKKLANEIEDLKATRARKSS